MLAIAALRVGLHGNPPQGAALYWLTLVVSIGFGMLLGGYRTDFAVGAFRIRQRLREQATTDELTGLRNRAGWNREAGDAYDEAIKRGRRASIVFLDIDHFKRVNDTYGHATGDRVLQQLGQILRERAGERCLCARLGGEEFVVLLIDQAPESVEGFVQRVRKRIPGRRARHRRHRQRGRRASHPGRKHGPAHAPRGPRALRSQSRGSRPDGGVESLGVRPGARRRDSGGCTARRVPSRSTTRASPVSSGSICAMQSRFTMWLRCTRTKRAGSSCCSIVAIVLRSG